MFNKYYSISACYERQNEETKKDEFVIVCNEIKGKGLLSSYTNYFKIPKEDFLRKFQNDYKKDVYNKWLERKILEVWVEFSHDVHGIVASVPEK